LPFLACLPLIEPDIPAVLALDQRCLGGLWTRSGYLKELESDRSDLLVLLSAPNVSALLQRKTSGQLAAHDPLEPNKTTEPQTYIQLLGIGCLWAIVEEAHITTLAIEPTQQRKKLGQLLLSELLLQGQNRQLTRATLEVRVSNAGALRLYQAFGFKEAGQRRRYYSDGENARVLWRSGLQEKSFIGEIKQKKAAAVTQLIQHGYQYVAENAAS